MKVQRLFIIHTIALENFVITRLRITDILLLKIHWNYRRSKKKCVQYFRTLKFYEQKIRFNNNLNQGGGYFMVRYITQKVFRLNNDDDDDADEKVEN